MYEGKTPKERAAIRLKFIQTLPYVRRLVTDERCEAFKWSSMSLKVAHDPILREKYRCKHEAKYVFRSLKNSFARDGKYCLTHLWVAGLQGDWYEEDRTMKYWDKFRKSHGQT